MRHRSILGALLLTGLVFPLSSCTVDPALTSISVTPATVTASFSAGLAVHYTAIGTYTRPGHPAVTKDITNQVTWSSSFPQMVTIDSSGVATVQGIAYGNGEIHAEAPGFHGTILGTAVFNVTAPPTSGAVQSLTFPQVSKAAAPNSTVQLTALGKRADGSAVELPGQPKWTSTDNEVATVDEATGLVTTLGPGRTTIVAVYTNPDGTTAVGVTHLTVAAQN